MTKEGSTKIVNFMNPGTGVIVLGRGHISHIVKLHYFFNNLLLYTPRHRSNKVYTIVIMTEEGSIKKRNFMTPWGKDSSARVWPYKSYS